MIDTSDKTTSTSLSRRVNKLLELRPENDKVRLEHNFTLRLDYIFVNFYIY